MSGQRIRGFLLSTTLLAAVAIPESARAQTAAPQLEEIVVSAEKRSESLQRVPVSVSVMNKSELERREFHKVADLQFAVPNLTQYSEGNFTPNIIIRGIGSSARNIGFESSLGVYVDGVFTGRTASFTQDIDDVEQIEVLRGPQGALYGKNTTIGALNITTSRPTKELTASASVELGNFDLHRVSARVAGPVVGDALAFKLTAYDTSRSGYVENRNPKSFSDFTNDDSRGVRGELLLRPSDRLQLSLRGDWSRTRTHVTDEEVDAVTQNDLGLPFRAVVPGARTENIDARARDRRDLGGVSLTADYDAGAGYKLTSVSAWRRLQYSVADADVDKTALNLITANYSDTAPQLSQEFRVAYDDGNRLRYLVGLYYFHQNARSVRPLAFGPDLTDVLANGFGLPDFLLRPNGVTTRSQVKTDSYAAFANMTFRLVGDLSLNAGLRYTYERKQIAASQNPAAFLSTPGILGANPIYVQFDSLRDRQADHDIAPTLGLRYDLNADSSAYVTYSKGFKSGGWNAELFGPNLGIAPGGAASSFNYSRLDLRNVRFQPENITNYEVGLKAMLLDRRLRWNTAVFDMEYSNIQVTQFVGGLQGFLTTNAGKARSRGVETELNALVTPSLELSAGVGYTDATYIRFADAGGPGVNLDGHRLDAPRWTVNLAARYQKQVTDELQAQFNLEYYYRSARPNNGLDPASGVPGFGIVDAKVALVSDRGWDVSLWARNLFDRTYRTSRVTDTTLGIVSAALIASQYGAPRTFGVRASYHF